MISKHKIYFKDGTYKTNVRVVEGYRPGPGLSPKQRQIKNFGYLEDAKNQDDFWAEVDKVEQELKDSKEIINISLDPRIKIGENKIYSVGYKYLEAIYDYLEIDNFFDKIKNKTKYETSKIFKFLVIERILNPDSKRATYQMKDMPYLFKSEFKYHQLIRALDAIEENNEKLQDYINEIIIKKIGREKEYMFYDTTNFYFEKDYGEEGKLPQRGISKEHRTNPIVQFGLFMDKNKLPVRMMCFSGNTSDSKTYLPMMAKIKEKQNLDRIISVADKGMNSNDNLSYIYFNGDGYVFSQILRGKKGNRYHDKMFEDDKFIYNSDKTYKYRIFEEEFEYTKKNEKGKIIERKVDKRKVLIYWKKSIADMEQKKREVKLKLAEKYVKNNAYGLNHDASEYVRQVHVDADTGIVADTIIKGIDENKVKEDAKYDGYFCIITSEINYDNNKIHEVYGQLEKIEESFKICKTNLETRPMYVRTDSHIKAHLTICFVSLLICQLLLLKLSKEKISIERIQRALSAYSCEEIIKGVMHLTLTNQRKQFKNKVNKKGNEYTSIELSQDDEIIKDLQIIQKAFGEEFVYSNVKQEKLNKYLKSIKFAITK